MRIEAEYLLETPLDPAHVAAVMAGEQSSGTFVRVDGETEDLRARAAAEVLEVTELPSAHAPTLRSAYLERKGAGGPYRRATVRIAYPVANIGRNLPTLASTVSGNLYDIGEITGLRLEALRIPQAYRARYEVPRLGVAGTRAAVGAEGRPMFGTIIKPNVGMRSEEIAALVARLCDAGVDFIKDDEICANPDHAPLAERVPAVMRVIREHAERSGKKVMMAFNITDETDAMRRHADLIAAEGGDCMMLSLNWCGLSAVETLRRHSDLALHGHRNGYGAFSRHPWLGIGFDAYAALWRLAGVDHMHVHGIGGKFVDQAEEVEAAARRCLAPLAFDHGGGAANDAPAAAVAAMPGAAPMAAPAPGPGLSPISTGDAARGPAAAAEDLVLPAFSSGQWAGTLPRTVAAAGSEDFLFMAGGGILAHPMGAEAGIASLHEAWQACRGGIALQDAPGEALASALRFFGGR